METTKINLIQSTQSLGLKFYAGSMKLKDLFKNYYVPHYEPGQDLEVGYQRQARINRIKNVEKRVSDQATISEAFIDCIHLNIRSESAINYVRPFDQDNESNVFTFEYSPDFGKFYIEDGQTRLRGAELAYEEALASNDYSLAEKIGNMDVPINLSFCKDPYLEAYIFYLNNFYSQRIPPEGAIALIKNGYENGCEYFHKEVKNQSKEKDIFSYQIAEKLNQNSNVWANEMRDFNENNPRKISIMAVSKMIKPIFIKFAARADNEENVSNAVYQVVDAYWNAIKAVFPMMFSPKTKNTFNILKSTSAEVMTNVLSAFINDQFQNEITSDLTDPETYKKFLINLRNVKDQNQANKAISGQDIFRTGPDGAIGKYSSNAGKKQLALNIYYTLFPQKKVSFQ